MIEIRNIKYFSFDPSTGHFYDDPLRWLRWRRVCPNAILPGFPSTFINLTYLINFLGSPLSPRRMLRKEMQPSGESSLISNFTNFKFRVLKFNNFLVWCSGMWRVQEVPETLPEVREARVSDLRSPKNHLARRWRRHRKPKRAPWSFQRICPIETKNFYCQTCTVQSSWKMPFLL